MTALSGDAASWTDPRATLGDRLRAQLAADAARPDIAAVAAQSGAETSAAAPKKSDVEKLINYFATTCDLVNAHGRAYAVPRSDALSFVGPPGIAQPIGGEFRRKVLLASRRLPEIKAMSKASADLVAEHLAAMAHERRETAVQLRFAQQPERVVVDLGRQPGDVGDSDVARLLTVGQGFVLAVDRHGWRVADTPPGGIVFRRTHATAPLPQPVSGGKLTELADLLALDAGDEPFRLVLGWLLSLPFAGAVRPGLLFTGPPGTGKSSRLRLAASVLEPSGVEALGSSFGHNAGDDQVRAVHRAVPLWDNLTSISQATSDLLCCLITGTARETRALYSDSDLHTMPIARPVGLTAVGVPAGLRPDALDRLIIVDTPRILYRVDDAEVQRRFTEAHPRLLGAVADAVSAALRWKPLVTVPTEHRMAAHAHVLAAIDAAVDAGELPGCPERLLEAYVDNHRRIKESTAADDVFGGALLALLAARSGVWRGKASELLRDAGMHAVSWNERNGPGWPSSPRRVPEVLAHLQEGLSALGVKWRMTTVRGSTTYTFRLEEPDA